MSIINTVLAEKRAERRQLIAKAEVLAKQINDLEKELKATKPVAKPKPAAKSTTTAARAGKKK